MAKGFRLFLGGVGSGVLAFAALAAVARIEGLLDSSLYWAIYVLLPALLLVALRGIWLMLIAGGYRRITSYALRASAWLMVTSVWFALPAHHADSEWGDKASELLMQVAMSCLVALVIAIILTFSLPQKPRTPVGSGENGLQVQD